jgi:hypothetical protein
MERGIPDRTSEFADEGTNCHTLAAHCLTRGHESARKIVTHGTRFIPTDGGEPFVVSDDMIECVDAYLRAVRDYQGDDGELFVEQALPIGHITGEDGAEGTSDAVILQGDEIIIIDLKAGRGVEVDAGEDVAHDLGFQRRPNPQLALYALGALEKFGLLGDFETVRLVIVQPRVREAPSEYVMSVEELQHWAETVAKPAARIAWNLYSNSVDAGAIPVEHCLPAEDACRFCRAKATCPALTRSVEEALQAEFTDLTTADKPEQERIVKDLTPRTPEALGAKLDAVPLIEMWCKAIRAEAEAALLAGDEVPGYKLVQGRKGPRDWKDEAEAEAMLKSFRFKKDEMYDYSVISPTSAEKLLKAEPRRWAKMLPLIKQSDGRPSVAPATDPRPAIEIKPIESEFVAIQETAEDLI